MLPLETYAYSLFECLLPWHLRENIHTSSCVASFIRGNTTMYLKELSGLAG
jgi:hypothetical protein